MAGSRHALTRDQKVKGQGHVVTKWVCMSIWLLVGF